jgi:transcriptional regulator with XRE-family HTH domain
MDDLLRNYDLVIRSMREKKGFSVRKLAELSGGTHPQISYIENKKSALTLNAAVRISSSLELSLSTFLSSKTVANLPLYFQKSGLESEADEEYSYLNYNDIEVLDSLGLFSSGKAVRIITQLLKYLIESLAPSLDNEKASSLAHLLYNYVGVKELAKVSSKKLPKGFPDWSDFRYPEKLSLDNIRNNYLAGGVLVFLDIGAYIRQIRFSKKMSLQQLGDAVGLSHQGVKLLELQTAEKIKLEDILKLDIALGLKGELLDFSWKAAEFYAGIHRTKTKISDNLYPYQSFEIHGIEKLIVVSRLFQHYFPEDTSWLDWYRKQAINGFSELGE